MYYLIDVRKIHTHPYSNCGKYNSNIALTQHSCFKISSSGLFELHGTGQTSCLLGSWKSPEENIVGHQGHAQTTCMQSHIILKKSILLSMDTVSFAVKVHLLLELPLLE